jgi:glycosyltransferase involved in cell wall biosynthesis
MRVIYALPLWPTLYATYVYRELQWMRARGHDVAVIALKQGPTDAAATLDAFGLGDVPVLHLHADASVAEAIAFVQHHRAEVINAHMGREAADLARRLRPHTRVPYIVRLYGGDVHSNRAPNLAEILDDAAAVCAVSGYLADLLRGRRAQAAPPPGGPIDVDPSKLRICHDGLSAEFVAEAAAPQCDAEQIVGSIGRLAPIKRHGDIIEAVAGLADAHPGVRLRLIGGGDLAERLRQQAEALGVSTRVTFSGPLPWSAVLAEARRLHIYVQASSLEGFCTASVEAACQGLPLVLSRTGIHEECVTPGVNGHLFEPCDVAGLREGLGQVLAAGAAQRRRMGAASLDMARQRYVLEQLLPRVEAIFQAVVDRRPLPA